jgi:hypothetical protein
MTEPNVDQILKAFLIEDKRLSELSETKETGHPFIICTNIATWLKETFFPQAKIMGYFSDENPDAEIGKVVGGHDFVLIDGQFIIELWFNQIEGEECPILFDLKENPELVKKYYGDAKTWIDVPL